MKIVLMAILFVVTLQQKEKLIFLMTHFRHGARAPSSLNNSYDFVKQKWNYSYELTGVGKRSHYLLGLRNRIKYINEKKFLSEKFDPNELIIYSSSKNRSIMSVSSQLQGLYPQTENLGEILNEGQLKNSNPPININYSRIDNELKFLENNSLPYRMTIVPFQTEDPDIDIGLYEVNICKFKKGDNSTDIYFFVTDFNQNLGKPLNLLNERNSSYNYTFDEITDFCSAYISSYTDGRNLTKLENLGFNIEETFNICNRAIFLKHRDRYIANKDTIFVRGRGIMQLFVKYAKERIDNDIKKTSNINPKMLIISGHDTSISFQQLFLAYSLGLNISTDYKYPSFTSQMAFEISTNDEEKENKTYSDYFINYYFNDDHIFNKTAEEFFNKIEPNIWSDEQIEEYCASTNSKSTNNNNSSDDSPINTDVINSGNSHGYFYSKTDNNKKYKTGLIVLACLFGVSIIFIIFLVYLLMRKNNSNYDNSNNILQSSVKDKTIL